MSRRKNVNTDLVAAVIGFVIMAMFWGAKEGVGHLSIMFPNALLILIGIFSVVLLAKGFIKADHDAIFSSGNQLRIVCTGVFLLMWGIGIMFLGFLVTSLVVFPALVCYLASARQAVTPKKVGIWTMVSSAEVLIFYFIFSRFLEVPLPTGIFI